MFIQFKIIFCDNDLHYLDIHRLFTFPLVRQVRPHRYQAQKTRHRNHRNQVPSRQRANHRIGHMGRKYLKVTNYAQ